MVAQELRHHDTNMVLRGADRRNKTAGRSGPLPTDRRPSWGVSMSMCAREGNSPYGCGIVSEQRRVFSGGGE